LKNKRNPISLIEDSFSSLKGYLESELNNNKMPLTPVLINELEQEAKRILKLCDDLNRDDDFIAVLNSELRHHGSNGLLLKAEHFFISDLITAYQSSRGKLTDVSGFVLAYYYDAIRNNHFANSNAIGTLNKLAASDEFKSHLAKIEKDNVLRPADAQQGNFFILPMLKQKDDVRMQAVAQHFNFFMHFAFGQAFADTKDLYSAIGFKDEPVSSKGKFQSNMPQDDTLEKVMEELNGMVGLENIKKDITELINLLEIQKKRTFGGLKNIEITLHTVFLGPPGTGKTSVARLLSRIYKHLGFLSKGQLCETDREGMVAGYVGQTATKVDKLVDDSLGGVLFIDEAYGLANNFSGNDYGAEAINTLLKRMEDHRDDLAVVVAGYTEPMKVFVESNPGLRSRFNRFFHFEHFTPSELLQIFEGLCSKSDFILSEDAKEKLNDTFELLYAKRDEGFGNARTLRNLFEKCVQNQANRIIKLAELNPDILRELTEADIPEPKETEKQVYFSANEEEVK